MKTIKPISLKSIEVAVDQIEEVARFLAQAIPQVVKNSQEEIKI